MATGDIKRLLDRVHSKFGRDETDEMPKLAQLLALLAQNQSPIQSMPTQEKIVPPNPMAEAQTALMTNYPFTGK